MIEETEESWFGHYSPADWRGFLSELISPRKQRLFAVACCRRVWEALPTENCRRAVVVAERYADGNATVEDLDAAREATEPYVNGEESNLPDNPATYTCRRDGDCPWCEVEASSLAADRAIGTPDDPHPEVDPQWQEADLREADAQMAVLRDIVGNPFHPVTADPRWLTSTVVDLARGMYEARDFGPMPILADALQDAGCEDTELLAHCRGPGPHVRGCWVVDLVLSKG